MRLVILAAGRGIRLREETGGRAKVLLDIAGRTILERAVELAEILGLEPLVVTRREHAAEIGRTTEVLVEEGEPSNIIETLYYARSALRETFCWMGGDMVFSDPVPLQELFSAHRERGCSCSVLYCRTDRFKAKLELASPRPRVRITREGVHELSMPTFMAQEPRLFADMAEEPRDNFLQTAIDRGDPILYQLYSAPLFEIDTAADLAAARRFFAPSAVSR